MAMEQPSHAISHRNVPCPGEDQALGLPNVQEIAWQDQAGDSVDLDSNNASSGRRQAKQLFSQEERWIWIFLTATWAMKPGLYDTSSPDVATSPPRSSINHSISVMGQSMPQ